jgi:GTP pyrophosphokinase
MEHTLMILTQRFHDALGYAMELHGTQARKGTTIPYLAHLLAVASLVIEHGSTEDEAIAALLHDAIEDQGGAPTREEIRRRFGDTVVAIVDGCTDAEVVPKPPWRQRKEAYIAHLQQAPAAVQLVSIADKLHNARAILADYHTLGETLWARFHGGREGTLWYYRTLLQVFREVGTAPAALIDELDRVIRQLESFIRGSRVACKGST